MSRSKFGLLAIVLVFVVFVPQVFGHAPLAPGNNESLATATVVPDATKSWAIYSEFTKAAKPNTIDSTFRRASESMSAS